MNQNEMQEEAAPNGQKPGVITMNEFLQGALSEALDNTKDSVKVAGDLLVAVCHGAAECAGWWTDPASGLNLKQLINSPDGPLARRFAKALVAEKIALQHSELSEAMEGHRKGLMDDKLPHRTMLEVEFADAIIRICDTAGALGLDLGGAISEKLAYNAVRPDHKPEARNAAGGKAY